MRILAIITGSYGQRHIEHIRDLGPESWQIEVWEAPNDFPPFIDDPNDFLPPSLPQAELILSFAEEKGAAELLPEIAKMSGAKAVLAAIDDQAWLPRGLAGQLHGWLEELGVACATPKPLCSLTETHYGVTREKREEHHSPLIAEFGKYFGQPRLKIEVDEEQGVISGVDILRDSACGCTRFIAKELVGVSVEEAGNKAGLLVQYYPCMASVEKDPDFGDGLLHFNAKMWAWSVDRQVKGTPKK
jgi:hypothetical protein